MDQITAPLTRHARCFTLILLVCSAALKADAVWGSSSAPRNSDLAQLQAVFVERAPAVDGDLSDPCWQQAAHVEGFWRESVDAPEVEPTEAWVCYSSRAVYFAFKCHDSKASEIRYFQKKRQGALDRDDFVQVALDVENAGRTWYKFKVNAAGTQWDEVPGGTSEKIEWKGDWHAAARIDDNYWTAEMEVPFSILRYARGQNCFRFYLTRRLARREDFSQWPPDVARYHDASHMARLTDLATPSPPFRYVIMPYALSVISEQKADRETLTGGLDFKGTLPNGIVSLFTYHPDFRNIEDVVETIDFTFVERYLPEYRPFFQEGGGFGPPSIIFYSRRIGELDWAAKAFGMVASNRFSFLSAFQRGSDNHLALNYQHLIGTTGSLGFSAVERVIPSQPNNTTYALGTHWNWPFVGGGRFLDADIYRAHTQGEVGNGNAMNFQLGAWRANGWTWLVTHDAVGRDFRADDGYVPETGVHSSSLGLQHQRTIDQGPIIFRHWYASFTDGASTAGSRRDFYAQEQQQWRKGYGMILWTRRGKRDGFDVVDNHIGGNWNRKDISHSGSVGYTWGERYGLPYKFQSIEQAFRPTRRLYTNIQLERVYAAGLDESGQIIPPNWIRQLVLTTTYDAGAENSVSLRLVRRAASTNVYAAYRQRVREGADVLIVIGDPNTDRWVNRLAIKAIWCL